MNVADKVKQADSYQELLGRLGREPVAEECLAWAEAHAGHPEEARALTDAGWIMSRKGAGEEVLAVFRRAADCPGVSGLHARVGVVGQLLALGRGDEAEAEAAVLRGELSASALGFEAVGVYDDMVETLTESARPKAALEWCQEALDLLESHRGHEEWEQTRHGLLISRNFLRRELGIELDEEDVAAEAEADAALSALRETVLEWDRARQGRRIDPPEDGGAFDGIVLRWTRQDFPVVRSRWPESTALYGDDYGTYAQALQREARAYEDAGAARVHLVTGTVHDYEAYAREQGRDPGEAATRRDFGEWLLRHRADRVSAWPPARNGPCWCNSGSKYKKCCGAPSRN
ncbi:SEC-C domain-containing protein [Streptomyces sp. NPDC059862]|uniref:SEC-C domain-containing protein n=1 Tax=unclassified Streptomyces TaxID=2593676 RepID=UPI003632D186